MKKILLLLILVSGLAQAQIVNIPDSNFKNRLLQSSATAHVAANLTGDNWITIDANADGEIQLAEALLVGSIDVSGRNISDLMGIESFTNLTSLNCGTNQLTSLNINMLTSLRTLICSVNQLTTINLSNLINLRNVNCYSNQLASLNVSGLNSLNTLNCSQNQLTSLILTGCPVSDLNCSANQLTALNENDLTQIVWLNCSQNQLTTLNPNGMAGLYSLVCSQNQLSSLEVHNLTNLGELFCAQNQISTLNVSGLNNFQNLRCANNQLQTLILDDSVSTLMSVDCSFNQLTTLDVTALKWYLFSLNCSDNQLTSLYCKNGQNESVTFTNNPNLQFICVDEIQMTFVQSQAGPSVSVNSYCSFTPGGNYNLINGLVHYDTNGDGCDALDIGQPFIKVNITDGTNTGTTFLDTFGNYSFYTLSGTFTVAPDIENPSYFNFLPSSGTVNFPSVNNAVFTQDFCIAANGNHTDVEVAIATIIPPRPGMNATYKIVFKNKGNQITSGNVDFNFDDAVMDLISSDPAPNNQTINTVTFSYDNLLPFENRDILITMHVNSPTDVPAINVGSMLNFSAVLNPIADDENPEDNIFPLDQNVVNSYDPNDKTCLEGNIVAPNEIGNYLHYMINFENTGTAPAVNVVVKDVIDITKFDINSLQVMNSSHPVQVRVRGNIVEFIFESINLPPSIMNPIGGHGNVLFKIKTLPTLQVGDMVTNTANIYFDYNHPIETNEARTTFATLSNAEFTKDNSVGIYPNPAQNKVNIKADSNIKSVQLFDIQGRIIETVLENKNNTSLDVSGKSNGIYFVKVTTEKGSKVEKLVKE